MQVAHEGRNAGRKGWGSSLLRAARLLVLGENEKNNWKEQRLVLVRFVVGRWSQENTAENRTSLAISMWKDYNDALVNKKMNSSDTFNVSGKIPLPFSPARKPRIQ
jgi:hypothetical protein